MSVQSSSVGPQIPPEPVEWRTRSLWAGTRLWCGAVTFFQVAFFFAYFYLRSLDTNRSWTIGPVNPSGGLGVSIMSLFVLSAAILRMGHKRPTGDRLSTGLVAIALAIAAIVLQFVEYTTLDFGGTSGGYASVFIGWTACYTLAAIAGLYWIETQVATLWRASKRHVDEDEAAIMSAGIEAASFFWLYYAIVGVVMFVVLYVV